jgi:DNA-binding SARP family transcriptional activator
MNLPLLPERDTLIVASETSSSDRLLESGLLCVRQGRYIEGLAFFALARERLSPERVSLAEALDTLAQSHTSYLRTQEELHQACKRFAKADAEQQEQIAALEILISSLTKETNRVSSHADRAQLSSKDQRLLHILRLSLEDRQNDQAAGQLPPGRADDQSDEQSSLLSSNDTCPSPEFYITCFGRFEVSRLGKPIELCSSRNGRCIFRYLVSKPGHSATSDTLQALLWPEDEAIVAQRKLHIAISALRRSLGDGSSHQSGHGYILYKNHVYYLDPARKLQTDVDEFLSYYQAGQQKSDTCIAFYEKACRLYTGPFLTEDIYADWSALQRGQLSHIYLNMCRVLSDHYSEIKRYEEAIQWVSVILTENRCDEAAHQQLIRIYAAQGRRHEALQQYQRCVLQLRDELGVEPLHETNLLLQHLLANENADKHKENIKQK